MQKKPNVVFVFGDQWRAQALGYAGDPNVKTPNLDRLAAQSVNCVNAYSPCPVCSPYRASLITGRRPLEHGVFLNDVHLEHDGQSIADAFSAQGYDTAYIGKWHLNGLGRSNYILPEHRQGFDYWKVLECTHNYNNSPYYSGNSDEKKRWEGYDAYAQTQDAVDYIRRRDKADPFMMILSWGPPHNPYETAPQCFKDMYRPEDIILRENVPADKAEGARVELAGYYAHCSALDECVGMLLQTLDDCGIAEDTVFVFTSDHGDMLQSQGQDRKQKPFAESIRVPFLLRYPRRYGTDGQICSGFLGAEDVMPTLLEVAGCTVPESVTGRSFVNCLNSQPEIDQQSGLIACYSPFGEFERRNGGMEYRGVVNERYTYVRYLDGSRLLFDDTDDVYQQNNLADLSGHEQTVIEMEKLLQHKLDQQNDTFEPGENYIARWEYPVNENGTIAYY